jgi:hypothetical protein
MQPDKRNKKVAVIFICLFFVYVMLSMFNSLYWAAGFDDSPLVASIGSLTDGETLEIVWIPGQVLGFFLTLIIDADVTIVGALLTFLVGTFIITRLCKLSVSELMGARRISQ